MLNLESLIFLFWLQLLPITRALLRKKSGQKVVFLRMLIISPSLPKTRKLDCLSRTQRIKLNSLCYNTSQVTKHLMNQKLRNQQFWISLGITFLSEAAVPADIWNCLFQYVSQPLNFPKISILINCTQKTKLYLSCSYSTENYLTYFSFPMLWRPGWVFIDGHLHAWMTTKNIWQHTAQNLLLCLFYFWQRKAKFELVMCRIQCKNQQFSKTGFWFL